MAREERPKQSYVQQRKSRLLPFVRNDGNLFEIASRNLLFIFLLLSCFTTRAQEQSKPIVYDSSVIEWRKVEPAQLEKLRADPEMNYGQSTTAVSLWERFKRWLGFMINRLLESAFNANWFAILIIILVIVGLVYVILRLLRVDALSILYSNQNSKPDFSVLHEDIHAMDFEKLVNEALQRKEYRTAIRLLFLQALKLLADRHHILWQPGKTNHDYLEELQAGQLKTGFNELNFYFEYAWYGNFSVNEALYLKVHDLFKSWRTAI
jgi:hypothetical protein